MYRLIVNGNVITDEMIIADNFRDRLLGYMFRKIPQTEVLLITPCNSIHTFFMRFNIDILFVSSDDSVIKKIENLNKNKMIFPIKNCKYVIEAKTGTFKDISEGDEIEYALNF